MFIRDSGYLFVIAAIPGLERITQYWFGNDELLRGHSVSFWTTYALAAVAAFLWIFARRDDRLTTRAYLVPLLLIAVSLYTLARLIVDNELFNLKALVLFLAIVLITIKPPRYDIAKQASIVLGLFVILAAALSLGTSAPSLAPTGFNPDALIRGRLLGAFGIESRWEGPFGNVNYASIAGAMTVLLAFLARGPLRWFMAAMGVLMLLLSQGRAATVALGAGLLVLALWSTRVQGSQSLRKFRSVILVAAVALFGLLTALGDLSGGGRKYIWQDYLAIGASSPIFGVGNPGIGTFVRESRTTWIKLDGSWVGIPPQDHGHSLFVDQWARGGLLGLVVVVAALVTIAFFAWRQANSGIPFALAMVVFAAVSGIFETTVTWNYLTVLYAPVLVAWMLSLELQPRREPKHESATAEGELLSQIHADSYSQQRK